MRRILFVLITVFVMAGFASAEDEYTLGDFLSDSTNIELTSTYTAVGSLTVTMDSAIREHIIFVFGEAELWRDAEAYIAVSHVAGTADSGQNLVLGNDTLYSNSVHTYKFGSWGQSKVQLPVTFPVYIDHDTTAAVKLYINVAKQANSGLARLHNLSAYAIENLRSDSL